MSDLVEPKVEPQVEPAASVTVETLQGQLEQIKRAQAGSDKAYAEAAKQLASLQAENQKLQKDRMSEKEKAEYDLAQQKAEIEVKSREVKEATLHLSKVRLMGANNVPLEFAEFISGNDDAELTARIDTLNKLVEAEVGKRVQARLLGTGKPQTAEPKPKNDLQSRSLAQVNALGWAGEL